MASSTWKSKEESIYQRRFVLSHQAFNSAFWNLSFSDMLYQLVFMLHMIFKFQYYKILCVMIACRLFKLLLAFLIFWYIGSI